MYPDWSEGFRTFILEYRTGQPESLWEAEIFHPISARLCPYTRQQIREEVTFQGSKEHQSQSQREAWETEDVDDIHGV